MHHVSSAGKLVSAAALSAHVDPILAAEAVTEELLLHNAPIATHAGEIDLCLVFVSGDHTPHTKDIARHIRRHLDPACLIAVSASGVAAHATELEDHHAVAALCLSLPGTTITPFTYTDLPHATPDDHAAMQRLAETVGADHDLRATLFFADPYSVPTAAVVQALDALPNAVTALPHTPVIGALASAAEAPRQNRLVLNDRTLVSGGVGITIKGDIDVSTTVAHACRPIGEPFVVTSAKRNILLRLGGQRAMDALRDTIAALEEHERERLSDGLYIGRVANEYKPHFGRGDFAIRDVMGVDQEHGAVAVAEQLRPGQTVQFQLKDPDTATQDLELLLQSQVLNGPAAAALLFAANKRGERFFDRPDHDAAAVARWLKPAAQVEPKPNTSAHLAHAPHPAGKPSVPLAGLFSKGEIAPLHNHSVLNHQTATVAVFRPRSPHT